MSATAQHCSTHTECWMLSVTRWRWARASEAWLSALSHIMLRWPHRPLGLCHPSHRVSLTVTIALAVGASVICCGSVLGLCIGCLYTHIENWSLHKTHCRWTRQHVRFRNVAYSHVLLQTVHTGMFTQYYVWNIAQMMLFNYTCSGEMTAPSNFFRSPGIKLPPRLRPRWVLEQKFYCLNALHITQQKELLNYNY